MTASGVLGRGSFRSVIAGTAEGRVFSPSYHPCANELVQLNAAHREVVKNFYIRDRIFDNKFSAMQFANGLFKLNPQRREQYHLNEVMPAIRRRTFWMQRIQQQRAINSKLVKEAEEKGLPHPAESLRTADANAYFKPKEFKGAVNWPDFWHHPSQQHLVPKPRWQRHPELKGITRVHQALSHQANDF